MGRPVVLLKTGRCGRLKQKPLSFEESIKRLEEIVGHLEKGDLSLHDSIRCFEEGNMLVKECSRMLDEAEQKVVLLREGNQGEAEEAPFEEPRVS